MGKGRGVAGVFAVMAGVGLGFTLMAGGASEAEMPWEVMSDWRYYNNTGWQALQRGKLERAEQAFRIAIKRMKPYEATQPVFLARSYTDLARVLDRKGRFEDAAPLARWALAVREKVPGKNMESLCESLELFSKIEVERGRLGEVEPLLKRVVAIREQMLGAGHRDLIPSLEALADVYSRLNRLGEAEPIYRRALALREATQAESVRLAEEQERRAAMLNLMIATDGSSGIATITNRGNLVQKLEGQAHSLREASAESLGAAATNEGYSRMLRRSGRVEEADDYQAKAKGLRDAVETKAAKLRAAPAR